MHNHGGPIHGSTPFQQVGQGGFTQMGRLDASQDSPLHHSSFYHSHVQPENAGLVIGQLHRNEFRDPLNPTRVTDAPNNRMNVYDARPKQTEHQPRLADFDRKGPMEGL